MYMYSVIIPAELTYLVWDALLSLVQPDPFPLAFRQD